MTNPFGVTLPKEPKSAPLLPWEVQQQILITPSKEPWQVQSLLIEPSGWQKNMLNPFWCHTTQGAKASTATVDQALQVGMPKTGSVLLGITAQGVKASTTTVEVGMPNNRINPFCAQGVQASAATVDQALQVGMPKIGSVLLVAQGVKASKIHCWPDHPGIVKNMNHPF
jgi:hypothetical protein